MAGIKISALPSVSSIGASDYLVVDKNNVTSKGTVSQLSGVINNQLICNVATTASLTATYDNAASGVGATLTNSGALAALAIDGITLAVGNTVLVKNQASSFQNGIYTVTVAGSLSVAWVLTRATYFDQAIDIDQGDCFTIGNGAQNAKTQWLQTALVAVIGTDAITFESNVVAGSNLIKVNNTISATGNITWLEVVATSANMSSLVGYIANNVALVSLLLPSTSIVGDILNIVGKGSGGWKITQAAGQKVQIGSTASTVGVGGSVSSANQFDSIQLVCTVANTTWTSVGGPQSAGLVVV
jgi:hypothetical protein